MAQDYYSVLGVERNASAQDIRRAYRRLAKQHHPDLNNGDAGSDAKFKQINEAYEVLKDPQKRAAYDRFGHAGVRQAAGGAPPGGIDMGDLGDIFEQFFGFGGRQRQRQRQRQRTGPTPEEGADMRVRVKLPFEEAVFGTHRRVDIVRRETCDTCDGSGAAPGTTPTTCSTCEGAGQVRRVQQSVLGSFVNVHTCPDCRGKGTTIQTPCEACRGRGRTQHPRTLEVDIPAGVDSGTRIRLAGEGEHGRYGGSTGDLFVQVEVDDHPRFRRDGVDLHVSMRVNPADAALGAEVELETLDGVETVQIPSGTQSGDVVRLTGEGVPRLRSSGRGDMVVEIEVQTPEKLSREQRELMERLRATLPQAEVVERGRGGFWDRVRERFS